MRTKEEILKEIRISGLSDAGSRALLAELEILRAEEYLALLQKMRENVHEVLAAMNSEILRFREIVDRAATDGSVASTALIRWTKVLAIATGGLLLATVALVYATLMG